MAYSASPAPVRASIRTLVRALTLVACGVALASAWAHGLYATVAVALVVAGWVAAVSLPPAPPAGAAPASPISPARPMGTVRSERQLVALLDLSPVPLVILDSGGRLRVINRAARRLFAAEDLVADPPAALVEAIAAGLPGHTAAIELVGRTCALVTSDLAVGGATSRLAALIDIDAELKAAEASTLRDLIQVLSHEIMNALTPIASLSRTAADMLDDPAPDAAAIRDAVGTIARRAAGLHRFGQAYRELARLPAPTPERIEVAGFVADLARLFATRWPAIALDIDAAAAPAAMRGDADQLTAAIWALLQNAAEAGADAAAHRVRLTIEGAADAVLIAVADSGAGVGADDADAIFRPFFTTKRDGSGIGLAMARQILRGHGGDLALVPCDLGGACFRAALPAA